MQGGILQVWEDTYREIWDQLAEHGNAPTDLYIELYRELVPRLAARPNENELATLTSEPVLAEEAFRAVSPLDFTSESQLIGFLETAADVLDDFSCKGLTDLYFRLLGSFVEKYSLRYDLRRPCSLSPTLSGIFSSLMSHISAVAEEDEHVGSLLREFEDSIRDLRSGRSGFRIKTVIQKQCNLLEAIGAAHPNTSASGLGAIANELDTWPHAALRDALKNVYKFSCDYPGIRHAGQPANILGEVATRDLIGVGIVLIGFAPYLIDSLDGEAIFLGDL
ncbi:MAG TPA: hypothetical protein VK790_12730 [Solirubrobacteraceae bacterium]|jgi:hypothetical protein|nr:hypothetical protein [Solirubrobacteraceae bacterium]